jgi:hypothetical protein
LTTTFFGKQAEGLANAAHSSNRYLHAITSGDRNADTPRYVLKDPGEP